MTPIRSLDAPEASIRRFAHLVRTGVVDEPAGTPRLGIDLGTANIVVSVVDDLDRPVAGGWVHSTVVRDGVVVDWAGATSAVRKLTADVETRLGHRFTSASVSVPPGISEGDTKVFRNVAGAAGLDVTEVVDEPVAAARALGITDGCVIDVGHGTTGVSVLRDGAVELSVDEATGGHHMSLVIAGALRMGYEEAELFKRDPANADLVFGLIRPTIEKMATIAANALDGQVSLPIYLVGGASSLPGTAQVFTDIVGAPVTQSPDPLYPTPLGTAMRRRT